MIYILSSCTNSKKIETSPDLILGSYDFMHIEESLRNWNTNKNSNLLRISIAKDLYKGHAWQETLKAQDQLSKKFTTKLLISSAGYGLIDSEKKISSYQATFSKSTENSISNFRNTKVLNPNTIWWDNINDYDISTLNTDSYMFICVSYEYLIAMQNTIKSIIDTLQDKLFIILLSKEKLPTFFKNNILRFDTRFNTFEKGTISSIIPRFTKWLFSEIVEKDILLDNKTLQNHIDTFLLDFDNYKMPERKQLLDIEILSIINEQINKKNIQSKTTGLKDLRSQGYACSQDRYGRLFSKEKGK